MTDRWIFIAVAALVLRAGFAFYLAGISRSKNAASTLFRATVEIAVGILAFWLIGDAVQTSWRNFANPQMADALLLGSIYLIGPAIITGAALERSRTIVCIASAILMPAIIIPLGWRILQSGWLVNLGFVDEAGAVYIHFAAGVAALVVALALGPRLGKYNRDGSTNAIPGHNLPLATAGVLLIFIFWIPYIAGFASDPVKAALNTVLAASAGLLAASSYCVIFYGRQDVFLVYSGLLAGLVSATAGADRMMPICAIATGVVVGLIVPWTIVRLDLVWKIDDPAGGIAIHGLGGVWSALAVALFTPGTISQRIDRLGAQSVGLILIGLVAAVISAAVFLTLRATTGIRPRESDEFDGLDLSEFDLNAYPDFQQTTIKSYHLREM